MQTHARSRDVFCSASGNVFLQNQGLPYRAAYRISPLSLLWATPLECFSVVVGQARVKRKSPKKNLGFSNGYLYHSHSANWFVSLGRFSRKMQVYQVRFVHVRGWVQIHMLCFQVSLCAGREHLGGVLAFSRRVLGWQIWKPLQRPHSNGAAVFYFWMSK